MTTTPPKTFTEARQRLAKIPNINAGGCGVAALALARWARQHSITVQGFVFLDWSEYGGYFNHCNNTAALIEKDIDGLEVPNHILIKYHGHWYDIDQAYTSKDADYVIAKGITEEMLLYMINRRSWNEEENCFKRIPYVQVIADILNIDLSDVWIHYAGKGYYQPISKGLP